MNADEFKSPALGYLPDLHFMQCLGNQRYRHPAWRWQAALRRAAGGLRIPRPAQHFDQHVHVAARFVQKLAATRDQSTTNVIWSVWPGLRDALKIWLDGGWPRAELEAWLLTFEPLELVAERTQLNLVTVSTYQRYFFDVADLPRIPRDRLAHYSHRDEQRANVIDVSYAEPTESNWAAIGRASIT